MLRKLLTLGALVVVAVSFGVGTAAAKNSPTPPSAKQQQDDGFSDGRLGAF